MAAEALEAEPEVEASELAMSWLDFTTPTEVAMPDLFGDLKPAFLITFKTIFLSSFDSTPAFFS